MRAIAWLLRDTDSPVLLALQGFVVLAVGAGLMLKAEIRRLVWGKR